jgi:regulator of replication initiation timing
MSDLEKVVEDLKKENEDLKKEVEELKKRLGLDERPREEFRSAPPLQFNRMRDYWNWIKEIEEEMR